LGARPLNTISAKPGAVPAKVPAVLRPELRKKYRQSVFRDAKKSENGLKARSSKVALLEPLNATTLPVRSTYCDTA
jgi:hypothetical protein